MNQKPFLNSTLSMKWGMLLISRWGAAPRIELQRTVSQEQEEEVRKIEIPGDTRVKRIIDKLSMLVAEGERIIN